MRFVFIFACIISIPNASLSDISDSQNSCSATQQNVVEQALKTARDGIAKSIDAMSFSNLADEQRFARWFGTNAGNAVQEVKRTFELAQTFSSISNIWCPIANSPELEFSVNELAAYFPDGSGNIYLAPEFFQQSAAGKDSFAGVIFHELTHIEAVGPTRDHEYGVTDTQALAISDPDKARKNADNFQYYIEDLLFGI